LPYIRLPLTVYPSHGIERREEKRREKRREEKRREEKRREEKREENMSYLRRDEKLTPAP
jgi:glyoxylase-like metal-dependent hydrolase (beta-lactamase superfamily II)